MNNRSELALTIPLASTVQYTFTNQRYPSRLDLLVSERSVTWRLWPENIAAMDGQVDQRNQETSFQVSEKKA